MSPKSVHYQVSHGRDPCTFFKRWLSREAAKLSTRVKLFLCRLFMLIPVRALHTQRPLANPPGRVCVRVWEVCGSANVRVKHFIVSIYSPAGSVCRLIRQLNVDWNANTWNRLVNRTSPINAARSLTCSLALCVRVGVYLILNLNLAKHF